MGFRSSAIVLGLLVATSCSPTYVDHTSDANDGGDAVIDAMADAPDAYNGELGSLTGRVWVPNMAPGLVAEGEEIPVQDAVVYLSLNRPPEIPDHVYCERCSAVPRSATRSGPDGAFEVKAPPGSYWLIIEKAQFRLEKQIELTPGSHELTPTETTLPSVHDPEHGQWIPKIAVAIGDSDQIEDVLGKIRIGSVDEDGRYISSNGDLDEYENGGRVIDSEGNADDLVWYLDKMRQYHIIFFPCSNRTVSMLTNPRVQENLRRYVNEGGKLFVTDQSGEIMDVPFPPQITFGTTYADTTGSYDPADPSVGTVEDPIGSAAGSQYDAYDGEVADTGLAAWLGMQHGPLQGHSGSQPLDPSHMKVEGNFNWIRELTSVKLGVDHDGHDVFDTPREWVRGSGGTGDGVKHPLAVTFEPTGCGRVMYSTYHTTGGTHVGLYPQERILLYLIFEIGVCQSGPIIE